MSARAVGRGHKMEMGREVRSGTVTQRPANGPEPDQMRLEVAMRLVKLQEKERPLVPVQQPRRRWRPWLLGAAIALAVAALGLAVGQGLRARQAAGPVTLLGPTAGAPVASRLRITGTLEPVQTRILSQSLAGRATDVTVDVGDQVEAGQVLAR